MSKRSVRRLTPSPLFDESTLLSACSSHAEPIAPLHARSVWKYLLKAELQQYHPDYLSRLQSRIASRSASRTASRAASVQGEGDQRRRMERDTAGGLGGAGIDEEDEERDLLAEGDAEAARQLAGYNLAPGLDPSASAFISGAAPPTATSPSAAAAGPATPSNHSQSGDGLEQKQFAVELDARMKLEIEDDALLLAGANFPASRYCPTQAELDRDNESDATRVINTLNVPYLPARMYELLGAKFTYLSCRLASHKTSSDGSTTKLLIKLQDGQHIESVIMRHRQKDVQTGALEQRITLCVSSQVGCAMGCTFCATGTMGMRGNLMSGEILEQLVIANRFEKIRNIVFMGMGEPLMNYPQVLAAIQGMTDGNRFGLAPSRITLSTVGIIPRMLELTRDIPNVQLALSLHAPTQELRETIVPAAKSYPIGKLIETMDYFIQRSKKRVLIEYVLLDGINSGVKEAHELGALLKGKDVLINLIPYNSTSVAAHYHAPPRATSEIFQNILHNDYNLFTTIRVEMGADIDGACGQLALENQNLTAMGETMRPRGLKDDDEPSIEPTSSSSAATASMGCATSSNGSDIEDLIASSSKKVAAAKRTTKSSPTPVASPVAEESKEKDACCGSSTGCDKDASSSSSSCCASSPVDASSVAVAAPVAESSASASDDVVFDGEDEDDLTVGELLARHGVKGHSSSVHAAAGTSSSSSPAAAPQPYILPSERKAMLAREQALAQEKAFGNKQTITIAAVSTVLAAVGTAAMAMIV